MMKFVMHCSNCDPSLKGFLYKFTILFFINSENKSELFTINKKCTIEQQNMVVVKRRNSYLFQD